MSGGKVFTISLIFLPAFIVQASPLLNVNNEASKHIRRVRSNIMDEDVDVVRKGSFELPSSWKTEPTYFGGSDVMEDNFADLEGRISERSLAIIRELHGIKATEFGNSKRPASTVSDTKIRPNRFHGGGDFVDVSGQIEIL